MPELVEQVASMLESYAQSGDVVDLLNAFTIKATEITAGGVTNATASRVKEHVMKKDSVNVIKQTRTKTALGTHWSCWCIGEHKMTTIRNGVKVLKDLAKELAHKCDEEWDKSMSVYHIKHVETGLQCSIRMVEIDHLPIMDHTGSFQSAMIYINDESMKRWSTYDDGSTHVYYRLYRKSTTVAWGIFMQSTS